MNQLTKKWSAIKQSKVVKVINKILLCKYFPFLSTIISLICFYTGFDLLGFYNLAITAILICLFADDLSPTIIPILFFNVIPSKTNKSTLIGEYLGQSYVLTQLIILGVLVVWAIIFRFVLIVLQGKFKATPVFYGLCFLSVTFILNGIFSDNVQVKNFVYGLGMAFFFLGIFTLLKDDIDISENGFERVAYAALAFSLIPVIELIVAYCTTEGLITESGINRGMLMFGWGTYNGVGFYTNLSVPAALYLASRKKYGCVFTAYSVVMMVVVCLSCSRESMITAAIIYTTSLVVLFVKGKHRISNICVFAAMFAAAIAVFLIFKDVLWDYFINLFKSLKVDGEWNGNGRMILWKLAIENFKSAPIFGVGFYADLSSFFGDSVKVWPMMYHNTFLQILGACGIVGLIAYIVHRVQTVQCFFKNITYERFFVAMTMLSMLITNLFDIQLMRIMPTMIYSFMLAMLVKSEKPQNDVISEKPQN